MAVGTLYDRIGGETAIMAAVDIFYAKVLGDELTRPFFANLEMPAQIRKQVAFMSHAFGGPDAYRGRDLRTAHADLVRSRGLSDVHFDAVVRHLDSTLRELGVGDELIAEVLTLVGGTRPEVLDRAAR